MPVACFPAVGESMDVGLHPKDVDTHPSVNLTKGRRRASFFDATVEVVVAFLLVLCYYEQKSY